MKTITVTLNKIIDNVISEIKSQHPDITEEQLQETLKVLGLNVEAIQKIKDIKTGKN